MKSTTKSNLLDYDKLYNLIIFSITFCLLYIGINFFLSIANFLSLFFLAVGIFYFALFFFSKKREHILISMGSIIISIGLSTAFHYFL